MITPDLLLTVGFALGIAVLGGFVGGVVAVYLARRWPRVAEVPVAAPKSEPHAVNPARPRAPRAPLAADPDATRALQSLDPTRLDLMQHHTERGRRARGDAA